MREHYCAIVGLGGMGNWHRELIKGEGSWNDRACGPIEHLHLAGSFDIRGERQAYARSVGLHTYGCLEELLSDEKVDIVLCATPNDVHKEIVLRALEAGKNVVCEKPAALNSAQLQQMMDKAVQTGKFLTVHQNRRWDEDFLAVKNLYDHGWMGTPFRIESRVHGSRGIPGDWRQKPERGGGMVLDWGVHLLDQALMMVPEKVVRVYASFTNITNERVEDGFTVELTFENGLVFVAEVGTNNFIALPRWYVLCQGRYGADSKLERAGKDGVCDGSAAQRRRAGAYCRGVDKNRWPRVQRYLFGTAAAAGTGRYSRFLSQCDGGDRAQSRAGCQTGAGETRHAPDGSGIPLCADASICSV